MCIAIFPLFFILVGCGTIQAYEHIRQGVGQPLSTHVGGQVLLIQRTSDLPNAFGKADIWGGKVNRGYTELRYQGLAPDGRLVFRITEVETESTETTMSRYGGSTATFNTHRSGNSSYGTVSVYDAPRGSTDRLPPNTTEFAVDPAKTKEFTVGGVMVHVINATEASLAYQLVK